MKVLLPVAGRNARRSEKTTENFSRLPKLCNASLLWVWNLFAEEKYFPLFANHSTGRAKNCENRRTCLSAFTKDPREKEEEEEEEEERKYGGPCAISRAINFSSILSSFPFPPLSLSLLFFSLSSFSSFFYLLLILAVSLSRASYAASQITAIIFHRYLRYRRPCSPESESNRDSRAHVISAAGQCLSRRTFAP